MGCTSSSPAAAAVDVAAKDANKNGTGAVTAKSSASVLGTNHNNQDSAAEAAAEETAQIKTISKQKDTGGMALTVETPTTTSSLDQADTFGLTFRYACVSRRGRDPDDPSKPNQDCYSVHDNHATTTTSTTTKNDDAEGSVQRFHPETDGTFFGVYDGHGPTGRDCSQFVRERLPALIQHNMSTMKKMAANYGGNSTAITTNNALTSDQVKVALHEAHIDCNEELHHNADIPDGNSGTTAISLYLHAEDGQTKLTICNVGDSRAILGTPTSETARNGGGALQAVPLSNDQTPKRTDEAARCKQSGARILSFGEIDPSTQDSDDGTEIEDPPRVWSKKGKYPGTAFTRSLGDAVAETLGVFAEPEQMTLSFSSSVKCIVLASDGIFDVLSNQKVMNICAKHYYQSPQNPLQACQEIVAKSHHEWLLLEGDIAEEDASASYDDMTIICIFFGTPEPHEISTDATATSTADAHATKHSDNASTASQSPPRPHAPHQKRIRQKTLRNLEEMSNA